MALHTALAKLRDAPFILDAIRASEALAEAAENDGGPFAVRLLRPLIDDENDQLMAIAGVHALGAVADDEAAATLSELLSDGRPFIREHAAWALGSQVPRLDAVGRLVAGVAAGGFATVINQRALRRWAQLAPDPVALAIEGALLVDDRGDRRTRLVETLGLVPGAVAGSCLLRIAGDDGEALQPRMAAVAALGERGELGLGLIRRLAGGDGDLAGVARLAEFDLMQVAPSSSGPAGLSVAQLFLHADLDRELTRAGAGDNGGIATMLVRLGDALAAEPGIDRVLTMSRGSVDAAVDALTDPAVGHTLVPIPLLAGPMDAASAWPVSVAAERGIRRALTSHGRVDVLHLRMADVGSMAAAAVAGRLGIPTVFTLAPDPHAVIHALDMTGALSRKNFGSVDEREHYWFRTDLVRRLAAGAEHCALFPRPKLRDQLKDLLGVDIEDEPGRYTVVPEGIDVTVTTIARAEVLAARDSVERGSDQGASVEMDTDEVDSGGGAKPLAGLDQLVAALPVHRHGLPIALTVGRLHRVKGMATVVEAWAADPLLRKRCNLVIVGGDLLDPSSDERGQLEAIDAVLRAHPGAEAGLIMAGHRPNDVVARWMAAVQLGFAGLIGPGGVYVCGSLKEEFGLALIEAMAAGLVVVGPDGGGPATYVDEGVTGFLVDTRSPVAVGGGIAAALALTELELTGPAGDAERVALTRELVNGQFTIQAMANSLTDVYGLVTARVAG